jgi:hypothetical protein
MTNSFKFIYNTISSNKRCVVCSKSSHNPDEVSKFEWQNCEERSTNGNAMEYQIVLLVRLIFAMCHFANACTFKCSCSTSKSSEKVGVWLRLSTKL